MTTPEQRARAIEEGRPGYVPWPGALPVDVAPDADPELRLLRHWYGRAYGQLVEPPEPPPPP